MRSGKWEREEGKKVCYFDIDGVLTDYPLCWIEFIKQNCIRYGLNNFPKDVEDLNEIKSIIPYQLYKDIKWDYRESGVKENLVPNLEAIEVIQQIKAMGFHICVITSRPVKEHPSLFKQTVNWLDKNHIHYDDLIFDEDKHIAVLKRYPHLKFGVEDHRYYANLVASWGYRMYLIDNKYNQGEIHSNVRRLYGLADLADTVWETYISE